jgi:hypothetical protein
VAECPSTVTDTSAPPPPNNIFPTVTPDQWILKGQEKDKRDNETPPPVGEWRWICFDFHLQGSTAELKNNIDTLLVGLQLNRSFVAITRATAD